MALALAELLEAPAVQEILRRTAAFLNSELPNIRYKYCVAVYAEYLYGVFS